MKTVYCILICCILGLVSCGEANNLSSFSKRKYLKKPPKQITVKQDIQPETKTYANAELTSEVYVLDEIPEVDVDQEPFVTTDLKIVEKYSNDDIAVDKLNDEKQQMEAILNNFEKDIILTQHKSKDGELLGALIETGAPWWLILFVLFICILVLALKSSN